MIPQSMMLTDVSNEAGRVSSRIYICTGTGTGTEWISGCYKRREFQMFCLILLDMKDQGNAYRHFEVCINTTVTHVHTLQRST